MSNTAATTYLLLWLSLAGSSWLAWGGKGASKAIGAVVYVGLLVYAIVWAPSLGKIIGAMVLICYALYLAHDGWKYLRKADAKAR